MPVVLLTVQRQQQCRMWLVLWALKQHAAAAHILVPAGTVCLLAVPELPHVLPVVVAVVLLLHG
jgi:hypothetical protein